MIKMGWSGGGSIPAGRRPGPANHEYDWMPPGFQLRKWLGIPFTVIIEDIQELFQIEDAFWGCGQTRFK